MDTQDCSTVRLARVSRMVRAYLEDLRRVDELQRADERERELRDTEPAMSERRAA